MKPEEIRNLLGGYASGTLSDEEKRILFGAALEDQSLFEALADEQALKEVLDDPESRGYLREALEEVPGQGELPIRMAAPPSPVSLPKAGFPRWPFAMAAFAAVSAVGLWRWTRVEDTAPNQEVAVVRQVPIPAPVQIQNTKPPAPATPTTKKASDKPIAAPRPGSPEEKKPEEKKDVASVPAAAAPSPPPPSAADVSLKEVQPPVVAVGAVQPLVQTNMMESTNSQLQLNGIQQKQAAHGPMQPPQNSNGVVMADATVSARLPILSRAKEVPVSTYKLLRKSPLSGRWVAISPGTLLEVGDLVAVEVQVRPGMQVEVRRSATGVVPFDFLSTTEVRTEPIRVIKGLELNLRSLQANPLTTAAKAESTEMLIKIPLNIR